MKKVLITGGCGTVGTAFIKEFYDQYQFFSFSKNNEKQLALKKKFRNVGLLLGSIEDREYLINTFKKIKPDIVIHAAALKKIEVCEINPSQTIKINLFGSLNVIEASQKADVPITIGISSDRACQSSNVYGQTKNLMERVFFEANSEKNKFVCCRLSNIAGSDGSVIPIWLTLAKKNQPLKITDPNMNRFMMTPNDVAYLIKKAIDKTSEESNTFTLLKKLKAVNMLEMARNISFGIDVIGKRPGENLDETLISEKEVPFTHLDNEYILIKIQKNNSEETRIKNELSTSSAEKMTTSEIQNLIDVVKSTYKDIN